MDAIVVKLYRIKELAELHLEKLPMMLAETNWKSEFQMMIDDEDYTALKYTSDRLGIGDTFQKANSIWWGLSRDGFKQRSDELKDILNSTESIVNKLKKQEMDYFKITYFQFDEDFRPYLECEGCGFFTYREKGLCGHKCVKITICKLCDDKSFGTEERLKAHIKSKHSRKYQYNCEPCNFHTDSNDRFVKHEHSKEHKQKCGIERPEYKCEKCNKDYHYECDYMRHMKSCEIEKPNYYCEKCDKHYNYRCDYIRHCDSKKHLK